jgi:hypothetical protein
LAENGAFPKLQEKFSQRSRSGGKTIRRNKNGSNFNETVT